MWKEYHLSIEGILKGHLFLEKWYIKGYGVGPWGGASTYKNLLRTPGLKDASSVKSCLHLPVISLISVWIVISGFVTGSRGDVFVVRTSKPVENLWKNGLVWSRYSFVVTHSIYRKPRDWGLARLALGASVALRRARRQRGYGLRLLIFKTANNKVDLGQIRSEEIVYSRFINIPLG